MLGKFQKLRRYFGELAAQVREDWRVNSRDWTQPGFRALAVHRFGTWVNERSDGVLRSLCMRLYQTMYRYVRNHYGIEIPLSAKVGRRLHLLHQSGIVFHWKAEVGDDCVVRQNVTLGAVYSDKTINDGPKIADKVQIGAGAVIFAGIKIGEGAVIGPNTVVMTNVPPGARVVMEPPRVLRISYDRQGNGVAGQRIIDQPADTSVVEQ